MQRKLSPDFCGPPPLKGRPWRTRVNVERDCGHGEAGPLFAWLLNICSSSTSQPAPIHGEHVSVHIIAGG